MIDGKKNLHCRRSHCPRHHNDDQGQKLRELGAKEVHIRISSPPVKFPCHYGVDFSVRGELIAANYPEDEIARRLDVDSLHYLSMPGLCAR